jgi:hypothetical protein
MYPISNQFNALPGDNGVPPLRLNRQAKKNYPQLAEQLTIQLRQKKLEKQTCYPWKLNC